MNRSEENVIQSEDWRSSASIKNLKKRAQILNLIRDFFLTREVMEVETPLIAEHSVTDPFIQSIPVIIKKNLSVAQYYYLQTSPEYAMKRLLASGAGPIYQISKAFRQEELGRFHQPEFTMLEWYRPHFDHHQLMDEVDQLLQLILQTKQAVKIDYGNLFQTYLAIDPHQASLNDLIDCAKANNIFVEGPINDKDCWLDLLMSERILPQLENHHPYFIYDFPASLAALARLQPDNPAKASRFEVYFRGIELANGFHECRDPIEMRKRFENNLLKRKTLNLPYMSIDELFLASLADLPDCAGVALGIDRLIMLAIDTHDIADVISFGFNNFNK